VVEPIHTAVKGRGRFRVAGLRRSDALKAHIESRLSRFDGIRLARASTRTGTVLLTYHPGRPAEDVAEILQGVVMRFTPPTAGPSGQAGEADAALRVPSLRCRARPALSKRRLRQLVVASEDQQVLPWYCREDFAVVEAMGSSSARGLTAGEAADRFRKFGPNILPEAVPRSGLGILLGQLGSVPVALLAAAAGISVLTGGLADAVAIMGVVGINALIGYATESQSERTLHSLKSLVRPEALVLRGERVTPVGAEEVVPGDILVLRPGNYVAADARLIEAVRLSIDESALTGESVPSSKTTEALPHENIPLSERSNMCYMGTLVTGGQGLAVVVATARFTEMGRIQGLVGEARPPETPMERQLDRMGTQLAAASGALCGIVFFLGVLRGYGLLPMLRTAISLAVAAVPEGLPTVATTTLALGIREMRRRKVLIRHLDAVETLGAIQVICLDKTGTITVNRMSVMEIYCGMERIHALEHGLPASTADAAPPFRDETAGLVTVAALCNESEVIFDNGGYLVNGSPTENALMYLALRSGIDVARLKEDFPLIKVFHRAEGRNRMVTVHRAGPGRLIVAVKGSPSEVLSLCDRQVRGGVALFLSDEDRLEIQTENERMAGRALRNLGVAYALLDGDEEAWQDGSSFESGFVWLGILGMADPVRPGAGELMEAFHRAGIRTVMITGDQSPTAYAIGKALNLSGAEELKILDSTGLSGVGPEALQALAARAHVFARVSPANKLQIVQALQGAGLVVAMTGDGVNDSPALKAADVGVAMGGTGTDVAREVADVVLENDNLETMIVAVSRGRTIHANVRKSLHFLLATNLSEIMVTFAANVAGVGQPLTEMQLLWINLITDIFPGLALSLDPPEEDVLERPPRDPGEPIVRKTDFARIGIEAATISAGAMGAYVYGIGRYGVGPRAGGIAFLSLTLGQLLHTLHCRSERHSIFDTAALPPNRYLNLALGGSFALQGIAMAAPGLRSRLGLGAVGLVDMPAVAAGAILPFLANELGKRGRASSGRRAALE